MFHLKLARARQALYYLLCAASIKLSLYLSSSPADAFTERLLKFHRLFVQCIIHPVGALFFSLRVYSCDSKLSRSVSLELLMHQSLNKIWFEQVSDLIKLIYSWCIYNRKKEASESFESSSSIRTVTTCKKVRIAVYLESRARVSASFRARERQLVIRNARKLSSMKLWYYTLSSSAKWKIHAYI